MRRAVDSIKLLELKMLREAKIRVNGGYGGIQLKAEFGRGKINGCSS